MFLFVVGRRQHVVRACHGTACWQDAVFHSHCLYSLVCSHNPDSVGLLHPAARVHCSLPGGWGGEQGNDKAKGHFHESAKKQLLVVVRSCNLIISLLASLLLFCKHSRVLRYKEPLMYLCLRFGLCARHWEANVKWHNLLLKHCILVLCC